MDGLYVVLLAYEQAYVRVMGFITFFLLLINIMVVFAIDVACWSIGWQLGLAGLIAIIAFIIAYAISEEAALSPRDFFWNSDWGIFCKKLKWAWGTALAVYAIAYIALAFAFGDILGVMN